MDEGTTVTARRDTGADSTRSGGGSADHHPGRRPDEVPAQASSGPQLAVESFGKRFGDRWAVQDSHFDVRKGEFFGLLGPSGCGKTTTLNAVAGFVEPTVGDIRIAGKSVLGIPPHRRDTAMVFQNYALFPHLSAADNIAFGLKLRRRGRREITARVDELLNLVGLSGKGRHLPEQLSGGEQQRVAVARALAVEPEVILLDEPLSNLDARLRDHMRKELKRILGNGNSTVLFVTHDQGEAFSMCDRVAVMFDGRIQQIDAPPTIYREPTSTRLAEFIGEANLLPAEVSEVDSQAGLRVDITLGRTRCRCRAVSPTEVVPGQPGNLLVRPECVRLEQPSADPADAGDGGTALIGTVERIEFIGAIVQYTVTVADTAIVAWQFSNQPRFEPGAKVAVGWAEHDARFFPAGSTS
jgi:putative spermidine/putrescine transport system ATP-binding protein